MLLRSATKDEEVGKELTESRIIASPSDPDGVDQSFGFKLFGIAICPRSSALGICVDEDEVRYPLGIVQGVGDRQRARLRETKQDKAWYTERRGDGLEIPVPRIERKVGDEAFRQPAAAGIVADRAVPG